MPLLDHFKIIVSARGLGVEVAQVGAYVSIGGGQVRLREDYAIASRESAASGHTALALESFIVESALKKLDKIWGVYLPVFLS